MSVYFNSYNLLPLSAATELARKRERYIEPDLKKAIKTYEEALTIHTKKDHLIEYAGTQNDLGVAYGELFEINGRTEDLEKAINAFEEAATVFTKEDSPMEYAMTQNNLGVGYSALAEVTGRKVELKKAIQAFEEALTIYSKKDWPARHVQIEIGLKAARKGLKG